MTSSKLALMAGRRQLGPRLRQWYERQDEAARRRRARMWRAAAWLPRWLIGRKRPGVVESAFVVLAIGGGAQAAGTDGGLVMLGVIAVRVAATRVLPGEASTSNSPAELFERAGIKGGDEVDVVVHKGRGLTIRRRQPDH